MQKVKPKSSTLWDNKGLGLHWRGEFSRKEAENKGVL